jgi:hypothetical protein
MRLLVLLSLFFIIACKNKNPQEKNDTPFPTESKYDPVADSLELVELSKNQNPRNLDILQSPPPVPNFENRDDPANNRFLYEPVTGSWYLLPDTVGGKPFSFYMDHPGISPSAKDLVLGKIRPSDDDSTVALLNLATTDDSVIRPFYRWCTDHILSVSDGALSEMAGGPAMAYAAKFPVEFLDYYYSKRSGQYQWVSLMSYSASASMDSSTFKKEVINKLNANCKPCDPVTQKRIQRFTREMEEIAKEQGYF